MKNDKQIEAAIDGLVEQETEEAGEFYYLVDYGEGFDEIFTGANILEALEDAIGILKKQGFSVDDIHSIGISEG